MSTVVLLHGFAQTGASWAPVADALQRQNYRVLTPDIRGHGRASSCRPISFEACVEDLGAIPASRFTLVGYSMGGRIALHAALVLRERVDRLVLIGATAGIEDPKAREIRRAEDLKLSEQIERMPIEQFAREWSQNKLFNTQSAEVKAAVYGDRIRNSPAHIAAALQGIGTGAMSSLWHRLKEISVPTTIVVGQLDGKFVETGRRLTAEVRGGSLSVVPGAGHAVHLEKPDAVLGILARGLADNVATTSLKS